jgi:excisionase family DNA binding protein
MVRSLDSHPRAYVTVQELAEYWYVSRRAIHALIRSGALRAVRLGPRSVRISTADARDCEERMKLRVEPSTLPSDSAVTVDQSRMSEKARDQAVDRRALKAAADPAPAPAARTRTLRAKSTHRHK